MEILQLLLRREISQNAFFKACGLLIRGHEQLEMGFAPIAGLRLNGTSVAQLVKQVLEQKIEENAFLNACGIELMIVDAENDSAEEAHPVERINWMKPLPEFLQEKSPQLYTRYAYIKEMAGSGFQKYATLVGYLTDHGPQHYQNLETNLALLLPNEVKDQLAVEEIFLLLCAVHFHDVGLLSEISQDEPWTDVRKDHVNRTYDYIHDYYEDWGLNRFETVALKNICLGHSGGTLYELPDEMVIHRAKIRVQFLAALLRIADELDLDYTRVSPVILRLKKIPEESLKHWQKHEEIGGVLIDAKSWTLEVHAMPKSEVSKTIIDSLVEQKLQKELEYLRPTLTKYGLYYRQVTVKYEDFGKKRSSDRQFRQAPSGEHKLTNERRISTLFKYRNFDVLVSNATSTGTYHIQVVSSPAGEADEIRNLDLRGMSMQKLEKSSTEQVLQTMGTRLFESLFIGNVRARFSESLGIVRPSESLRIRLRLSATELQSLPWELLFDSEKREFLALSKRLSIVRYLTVAEPVETLKVSPPLRVLVVTASPINLPLLDIEGESKAISNTLSPLVESGRLQLEFLEKATKSRLREALMRNYHVLHFVGHGGQSKEKSYLALEDETRKKDLIDATTLGILLRGTSIRLTVLNSCKGAKTLPRRAFIGMAQTLVNAGLPAVVAMQYSIMDSSALAFARDFYTGLAELRSLDECIGRAREFLMLADGVGQTSWSAPILFMRTEDGYIYDPA